MTASVHPLLSAATLVCLLAACGKKEEPQPADLACADPAVLQNIQNTLQQSVREQAQTFARNDVRQFVDADKVIAAAAQMTFPLDNPQQDNSSTRPFCQAALNITLPADSLKTAHTNAPLIYGDKPLDKVIAERILGSGLNYNGSGTFAQTLKYTPARAEDGTFSVTYADNGLAAAANALSGALLPYGIKSLLLVDGKAVSLEDALKMAKSGGKIEIVEEPASEPQAASAAADNAAPAPEVLTPPLRNEEAAKPAVSDDEIDRAKDDHRAADSEINALWRNLEPTVQQGLQDEQREWINRKTANCRRAAAQADSPEQAEYLRLQCDTRQTRERIRYLRGYSDSE